MIFRVLFCLNLFISYGSTAVNEIPPIIIWNYKEPIYGEKETLRCDANGTNMRYQWKKDEAVSLPGTDTSDSGKTLTITLDDKSSGYYQCEAQNGIGIAVSDKVLVKKKNFPTDATPIKESPKVKVGDYLKLECPGKDSYLPRPGIIWKRSNAELANNDRLQVDPSGTLHISYVTTDDNEREFLCQFKDPLINTLVQKASYTLEVKGQAIEERSLVERYMTPSPLTALEGKNITLICIFSGAEDIITNWFHSDGKKVEGIRVVYEESTLIIRDARPGDAGEYVCKVNANGKAEKTASVQVRVDALPKFATESDHPTNMFRTTHSDVVIKCNAVGKPEPKRVWYRNGIELKLGNKERYQEINGGKELKISHVCKGCDDSAVFQCNASNVHGYVYKNGFLKIYDATKIITAPVNVEYDINKDVKFTCKAKTDEETQLSYKWLHENKEVKHGSIKTNKDILNLNVTSLSKKEIIGKWTCVASNGYSSDAKYAFLREKSIAAFPNWWILLLVLLILLLLLLIVCCLCNYLYKNRGSVYPVDEIEHKNGNDPEKELLEYGFHDYQRDVTGGSVSGTLRSQMGSTNSLARAS